MLRNPAGLRCIGLSDDVDRRVQQHNQGISRWTRGKGPWILDWTSAPRSLGDARKLENLLKRQKGGAASPGEADPVSRPEDIGVGVGIYIGIEPQLPSIPLPTPSNGYRTEPSSDGVSPSAGIFNSSHGAWIHVPPAAPIRSPSSKSRFISPGSKSFVDFRT